jgi:uncharacterized membrane protein YhaH (DUF805 family)
MVHNNDLLVGSSAALSIATFIPAWRIVVRVGMSRWWSLIAFVPFVGMLIILWIIAYQPWPKWGLNAPRP